MVGVWIYAGSGLETNETNGTAHLLKRCAAVSTALEEEIENLSEHCNAYTSREQATFDREFLDEDIPVDILRNSPFEEIRMHLERIVILREMQEVIAGFGAMDNDDVMELVEDRSGNLPTDTSTAPNLSKGNPQFSEPHRFVFERYRCVLSL